MFYFCNIKLSNPFYSVPNPEVYSEPCLISKMTRFAEIGSNLAIFAKHSVLKFRQATEYASSTPKENYPMKSHFVIYFHTFRQRLIFYFGVRFFPLFLVF